MENGDLITWQMHKCPVRAWALVWTALSAPYHREKKHLLPDALLISNAQINIKANFPAASDYS